MFVLTSGQKADSEDVTAVVAKTANKIQSLQVAVQQQEAALGSLTTENERRAEVIADKRQRLQSKRVALETLRDQQKQAMLDADPSSVPELPALHKQYLTHFKQSDTRVLFLLEASGGMLSETIDLAIERMAEPPDVRRTAPKWQRALKAIK